MIWLLNLSTLTIFLAWLAYGLISRRIIRALVGWALTMLVYGLVQPSYTPKGAVPRAPIPGFEAGNAEIEDRMRNVNPEEHYRRSKEMHEEFIKDTK